MIARIGSSLVEEIDGLAVQRHKLALEAHVPDAGDVVVPAAPVVFEKERNRGGTVPVRAVQRHFENIGPGQGLRDLEGLGWGEVGGGCEVEVVAVFEELHGFRGGGRRGGPDENGVDFYLASEAVGVVCC